MRLPQGKHTLVAVLSHFGGCFVRRCDVRDHIAGVGKMIALVANLRDTNVFVAHILRFVSDKLPAARFWFFRFIVSTRVRARTIPPSGLYFGKM